MRVAAHNAHDQAAAVSRGLQLCDLYLGNEAVIVKRPGWTLRKGGKGVVTGWLDTLWADPPSTRWRRAHGGIAGITPGRGSLVTDGTLFNGDQARVIDGHRQNGTGWPGNRRRARWRRRRKNWRRHDAMDRDLVDEAYQQGRHSLLGADVNRTDMPKPHPKAIPLRDNGITQLWYVPGRGQEPWEIGAGGAVERLADGSKHKFQWRDVGPTPPKTQRPAAPRRKPAPAPAPEVPMARSQNGYPANDISRTKLRRIPGTTRDVRLAKGEPGWLLLHFAAWFDREIESVDDGILDDWGYAERPIRGSSTELSNHASGTAIDLNAPRHWLGQRGTFTPDQERAIRKQLQLYDGCIRWGGDYVNRADEMHFEINRSRLAVIATAIKIRALEAVKAPLATVVVANVRRQALNHLAGKPVQARGGVKVLQRNLNRRYGADLTVDGVWGPSTDTAWRAHEQHVGIDGRPGVPDRTTVLALSGAVFLVK